METNQPLLFDSESVINKFYRAISKESKLAFITSFLSGMLVHLYMFTNKLPNHDDLSGMFRDFDQVSSGRWLIKYLMPFNTSVSIPWVNGVFAILMIAIMSVLIVRMFQIRRPLYIGLISIVMACSPVLATFFAYMFLADVNMFGAMLCILGAFLAGKHKFGFVFSAILFACSLAIYQTFIFFAAALMAIQCILWLTDAKKTSREVLDLFWRYAVALILGAIFYAGVTKLFLLVGNESLSYQNTAEILSPNLAEIPHRIYQCYYYFISYADWYTPFFNTRWIQYVYMLMIFSFYLLIALLALRSKIRHAWRIILAVLISLAMPMLWNGSYLAAGYAHILMIYSMMTFFLSIIILFCRYSDLIQTDSPNVYRFLYVLGSWFVTLSMIASCYSWALYNNQTYFALQHKYEASYALAVRVVDRVEQLPEYTNDTPVLVIGGFSNGSYETAVAEAQIGTAYSVGIGDYNEFSYMNGSNGRFKMFVKEFLGIDWIAPDDSVLETIIAEYDDFSDIPCFPAAGSVQYIDGIIVVKGSD